MLVMTLMAMRTMLVMITWPPRSWASNWSCCPSQILHQPPWCSRGTVQSIIVFNCCFYCYCYCYGFRGTVHSIIGGQDWTDENNNDNIFGRFEMLSVFLSNVEVQRVAFKVRQYKWWEIHQQWIGRRRFTRNMNLSSFAISWNQVTPESWADCLW